LSLANGLLSSGATEIVQEQVNRLVQKGNAKLGFGFIDDLDVGIGDRYPVGGRTQFRDRASDRENTRDVCHQFVREAGEGVIHE
jgi:hypothetical protein